MEAKAGIIGHSLVQYNSKFMAQPIELDQYTIYRRPYKYTKVLNIIKCKGALIYIYIFLREGEQNNNKKATTNSSPRAPTRGSHSQTDVFAHLWSRAYQKKKVGKKKSSARVSVCFLVIRFVDQISVDLITSNIEYLSNHMRCTKLYYTHSQSSVPHKPFGLDDAVKSYTQKHSYPKRAKIILYQTVGFC